MDGLIRGYSPATRIRFTYADVTESAQTLERRHLSGPTAGVALAQALGAVALLSADAATENECVTMQAHVDGPVEGLLVEAKGDGGLRGYTHIKVLNHLDGNEPIDAASALGGHARARFIRSTSRAMLNSADVQCSPADVRTLLARYYIQSMQTPAGVALHVESRDGAIHCARALAAERMPDGVPDDFVPILKRFESGAADADLSRAQRIEDLRDAFALPDLAGTEHRPLSFQCRCSYEKCESALTTLGREELNEILAEGEPQQIYCHFCGEGYAIPLDTIRQIRDMNPRGAG